MFPVSSFLDPKYVLSVGERCLPPPLECNLPQTLAMLVTECGPTIYHSIYKRLTDALNHS